MGGNQTRLWTAYFYRPVMEREQGGMKSQEYCSALLCSLTQHPMFNFKHTLPHVCAGRGHMHQVLLRVQQTVSFSSRPHLPLMRTSQQSQKYRSNTVDRHVGKKKKTNTKKTKIGPWASRSQMQRVVTISLVAFYCLPRPSPQETAEPSGRMFGVTKVHFSQTRQ